ncbi:MEDS domain-containing protein [Pelotomaculum sp. PtaB.Bin117]|uniref:MEDS domain-containing protein n=1 Tax=Pelotomaculum sp. PtaB.Bin117 TaxID=1811694 RepID=UPI0009CF837D|nr:MEDS domain-containing protein [Pelotomaculum sp. PtaB.Bin117]OPX87420.1 MAG: Cyclic di-GMP phosphodiesterase response regulator RpfG [Pelotomaculum sp. PtaB.Bin117]
MSFNPADIEEAFYNINPHDHFCLIYRTPEEWRAAVVSFLIAGLIKGDKCLYLADDTHTAGQIRQYLREAEIDVAAAETSGQLIILQKADIFTKLNPIVHAGIIDLLIDETNKAVAGGYPLLRVTGEMIMPECHPDSDKPLAYEARLNREFFPGYPCAALCQFNRNKIPPALIKEALKTHPLLVKDRRFHKNFYYIPPGEYFDPKRSDNEIDYLLDVLERERDSNYFTTLNQQLQDMIKLFPDATFAVNRDKKVVAWNQAIEEMTGMRKEDIIGKGDFAYAIPLYGEKRPFLIDMILGDFPEIEHQYDYFEKKGSTIYSETYVPFPFKEKGAYLWGIASPLFDSNGDLIGAVESFRDITKYKQIEFELRDHRAHLEKSINERTNELTVANEQLRREISERKQAEVELKKTNEALAMANEELIAINEELLSTEEELKLQFEKLQASEGALASANRRLQDIIEFLPDAIFVVDNDKRVIAWNRAIEEMTGVPKEKMLGKSNAYAIPFYGETRHILIDVAFEMNENAKPQYYSYKKDGHSVHGSAFVPRMYGGKGAYLWGIASPLFDRDGNLAGAIESIRDITEQRLMENQLKYLSMHDSLTGLHNRAYFEEKMRRLEERRDISAGIIVCDVDGLKLVNDTLGHDTGDLLLIAAASVIKDSFRENDMIARIGGDEFAVLLPNSEIKIIESACDRIQEGVARHNAANLELPLSISAGFAVRSDESVKMSDLFKEADNKMYREKLHRHQSARSAIVQTLMKALEARDFITEEHAERIQSLVSNLAAAIDLSERSINDLRLLAQFHDIGKIGIPDSILMKPGFLTIDEVVEMRQHCEIGHRIAMLSPDLVPIAGWILKHHEWWNGQGYPLGLKKEEIPLECRILAIADAYDAMTSNRPYRKAMSHEAALAELAKCADIQFDPYLVEKFVRLHKCR